MHNTCFDPSGPDPDSETGPTNPDQLDSGKVTTAKWLALAGET